MTSISFQNSDEFKVFTSKVCNHLSKTKLNQLRSAIAKELGHSHLSSFYQVLDNRSAIKSASEPTGFSEYIKESRGEEPKNLSLEGLGFSSQQADDIRAMSLTKRQGSIFISGITASGKSNTSRAILNNIVQHDIDCKDQVPNVVTIEDSFDTLVPYAKRLSIGLDVHGVDLESKISSIGRMDPDIAFIDEIRHSNSANKVFSLIKAGIQVIAPIHAQCALSIPVRLGGLEVEDAFDYTMFSGFIHQGLAKKVCKHCSYLVNFSQADDSYRDSLMRLIKGTNMSRDYSAVRIRNNAGCSHCHMGTENLTVLAEVIPATKDLFQTLVDKGSSAAYRDFISQGGLTIQHHAMEKVLAGEIDPVDVEGVVGPFDRWI